jgi:hypothetical protein
MSTLSGQCLCGAVRFTCEVEKLHADACHCSMCRRWAGGPALAVQVASLPDITGSENVAVYKSSDWGERHFCKICGSNLFWRAPDFGYEAVCAGTLDDLSSFAMTTEIFIDEKPEFYSFSNDTKKLTGAQVAALFAGEGDKS